jgi:hypothetical protein
MQKIAVQEGLDRVGRYLSDKGYEVDTIGFDAVTKATQNTYDAIVISGMSKDFMGISDTATRAPVIDASGMTEEEVYKQIQSRVHRSAESNQAACLPAIKARCDCEASAT